MGVAMVLGFGPLAAAQSIPEAGAVRGAQSGPGADAAPARHQVLVTGIRPR